jgi:hypothetical protein
MGQGGWRSMRRVERAQRARQGSMTRAGAASVIAARRGSVASRSYVGRRAGTAGAASASSSARAAARPLAGAMSTAMVSSAAIPVTATSAVPVTAASTVPVTATTAVPVTATTAVPTTTVPVRKGDLGGYKMATRDNDRSGDECHAYDCAE